MVVRALVNDSAPFYAITGNRQWGQLSPEDASMAVGDLVFNNEEDIHAAILSVYQTLDSDLVSHM
jgi:hypothetical protein